MTTLQKYCNEYADWRKTYRKSIKGQNPLKGNKRRNSPIKWLAFNIAIFTQPRPRLVLK